MKTLFVLGSVMVVLFLAAPNKIEAQKRKATKTIEGTISGYECGDNCYLTITDNNGKPHTGLCSAPLCTKWNAKAMMPDSYKGTRVKVTIGRGKRLTGAGRVVDTMDAFTTLQVLTAPPSASLQPVETKVRAGDAPLYAQQMSREKALFYHVKFYGYNDIFIDYYGFTLDSHNYNNSKSDEFERSRYKDRIRNIIKEGVSKLAFNDKFTAMGEGVLGEYNFNASAFPIESWSWKDNLYVENGAHDQLFLYYFSISSNRTIINLGDFDTKVTMSNDAANNFIKTRKSPDGSIDRRVYLKVTYSLLDKNESTFSSNQYIFNSYWYSIEVFEDKGLTKRLGIIYPSYDYADKIHGIKLKEGYQITERNDGTWVANLGSVEMEFVPIQAGSFMMGGDERDWEGPVHRVTISKPFHMAKYEVTQAQWHAVMGDNPSWFTNCGGNCPVERVSGSEVQEFIKRLNARNNGYSYRLPTEAEWEYAARAGTTGDYGGTGKLDEMGWYSKNSGGTTHQVGTKQPNAWGLYDMHGNVQEWCSDWYAEDYYKSSPATDPQSTSTNHWGRMLRGGWWMGPSEYCRSAARSSLSPGNSDSNTGFRVVVVR